MAAVFHESVIGFNIGGNYAAVVHHWASDDGGGETAFEQAEDLADALENDAGATVTLFAAICALMADDCFISSIRTRKISGTGGATFARLFAAGDYPGVYGGLTDAAQVAACMIKITNVSAQVMGRTYWPGISEDATSGGRFTDVFDGEFTNLVERYLATFTSGMTWDAVLKHGLVPTFSPVIWGELSPTPGTIRRRLVPV